MAKSKKAKPTPEQVQIQKQQLVQLTQLDDDENKRRKLLLSNAAGVRAFRGSALTRGTPSNKAGSTPLNTGANGGRGQTFISEYIGADPGGRGSGFAARSVLQ